MLKKIAIAIVVLVVLVIGGLLAVAALVDVDHYKPRIEQAVHDKTGRTLKIDGKLSLSVFPTIALALPKTTLSEHESDQVFLSLDSARVSLALLPLLSGRFEAGTASLYGLRASVDKHADGSTNLDDLTGAAKKTPAGGQPAAPPSTSSSGKSAGFAVGGIDIRDAQLVYRDEKAHNTVTLSKLNLKVGRLASKATTPVDLSAALDATEPKAHFDLSLQSKVDLDLEKDFLALRGLDAHVKGSSAGDNLDVELTAPSLQFDGEHAAGDALKLVLAVTGAHEARVDLALEKISGNGEQLSAAAFTLDADASQGPQKVTAHLGSPLQIGLAAQSVELSRLAGEIDLQSPTLPQKALKIALDGSLKVEGKAQNLAAKLVAKFDETTMASRLAVQGFSAPHIAFDVDIDKLNLDRYLPPPAPAPAGAKPAAAPAPGGAADPKVDLSALKPLNLAGTLKIGALQAHNLKLAKLDVGVHAAAGHLEVAPIAASLYEGTLGGDLKVDADVNRVAPKLALEGISIQPLLKDLMGKDILEGHGNVRLDLSMQGPTVGAMKKALGGTASLNLKDGAVRGIDLAQKLRDIKSALGGASTQTQAADASQKTDFSEMSASFNIKNGVATNNDLSVKSPLLRLGGAGTLDIGASSIDYTAKVSVVGTLAGQGGGDLSNLHGVTIPVHLSGPFAALSYQLDWGSIATQELKNKAADRLQNLLGAKKPGANATPNVGDALKGLLGK